MLFKEVEMKDLIKKNREGGRTGRKNWKNWKNWRTGRTGRTGDAL